MTDNDARRESLSVWFLEFSVLWAVFPMLDLLVEGRPIAAGFAAAAFGISLTTLALGLILRKGDRT